MLFKNNIDSSFIAQDRNWGKSDKNTSTKIAPLAIFILWLFFMMVFAYLYNDMQNSRNVLWGMSNSDLNRTMVHICLIAMIALSGIFAVLSRDIISKFSIVKICWLMFAWSTTRDLLGGGNTWQVCIHAGLSLMWIFLFQVGYSLGRNDENSLTRKLNWLFFAYFLIEVYAFLLSRHIRVETIGSNGVFNLAYNLIVFAPFFLLNIHNKLNKIFVALCAVLVFMTMKRGAIIIFPLMLGGYVVTNNYLHGKKYKTILSAIVITILLIIGFHYMDAITDGFLSHRFSVEELQNGSGRFAQFQQAMIIWNNSSLLELFFGLSFGTTQRRLGIAIHNEWLAWFVYYGILGGIMFFSFLVVCFRKYYLLLRARSPYAASYLPIIVYFFMSSLFSGFFFMHMTMILFITIGLIYGMEERRLNKNFDLHEK